MKRKLASVLVILMFLSFAVSTAAAFVPPGLAKKGGLPPGIQKRFFNGEGKEKFGKDTINQEYDTILKKIDVSNRRIMIQEGTAYLYLLVAEDAKIQLDGMKVELNKFAVGDEVYLKLNKDNTITEIIGSKAKETEKEKEEDTKTIKGASVESINYETRRMILNHNNTRTRYVVNDNATITANGVKRNLNYITAGMKVDVTVKDSKISAITVVDRIKQYQGKLINSYTHDEGTYILIEIDDIPVLFYIDEDLNIPSRLKGEDVYIEVKEDIVVDIWKK